MRNDIVWDRERPVVPFDKDDNMLRKARWDCEWRQVGPFRTELILVDSYSTGYSCYFRFEDTNGHRYPMFASDVERLMHRSGVVYGRTSLLTWTFVKRGVNYGIRPIFAKE